MSRRLFKDRREAGRQLATVLRARELGDPLIYALPRGGVPVAVEIAALLNKPVNLLLVRKLGVPDQPELAFGAVIDGASPETILNHDIVASTGLSAAEIETVRDRELAEIERRRALYFADREQPNPKGRICIVVDDGLATGATARVALRGLRQAGASHLILAVPVAPMETFERMKAEADDIICLDCPDPFYGVGASYQSFPQLTDAEMLAALRERDTGSETGCD